MTGKSTTLSRAEHTALSGPKPRLHNNGQSSTLFKNGTWEISSLLHSLHCGETSPLRNKEMHHSVDELNLGLLREHVRLGLLELVEDHRDAHKRQDLLHKRCSTLPPAPALKKLQPTDPTPTPSGNPLWGPGRRPRQGKCSSQYLLYSPTPRTTHTPPGHHTTHKHWG